MQVWPGVVGTECPKSSGRVGLGDDGTPEVLAGGASGMAALWCQVSLSAGQRAAWLIPMAQRSPASADGSGKQGRSWPVPCDSECCTLKPEEMG